MAAGGQIRRPSRLRARVNFLLALRERRRQRLQDRATVLAQLRDVVADATGDLIVEAIENAESAAWASEAS